MRDVIPFIEMMKEVSYIFYISLPKPEYFVKSLKTIKVSLTSRSLTSSYEEQNILLLSIIIYETSYKRKLFGYAILIQRNKQWTF